MCLHDGQRSVVVRVYCRYIHEVERNEAGALAALQSAASGSVDSLTAIANARAALAAADPAANSTKFLRWRVVELAAKLTAVVGADVRVVTCPVVLACAVIRLPS